MFLKHILLINFRNYDNLSLDFNKNINIIYGKNGQGKTNLLESIYLLGLTKSHRNNNDNNLIKKNSEFLKVSGLLRNKDFDKKLEIYINNDKKIYKIDNDLIKKKIDYLSNMNVVIFYPDDLMLIKGSPLERRKFLNTEISQLNKSYYKLLSDYEKILKMRNNYLKNNRTYDVNYFNIITDHLIEKAKYIIYFRLKFIKKINNTLSSIYKNIIDLDNFYIKYKSDIDVLENNVDKIKEKLNIQYEKLLNEEFKAKTTLFGPHRDDFEFFLADKNLRDYGSQGQQRSAVISLKLSLINIIKEVIGEKPILLLDDVFSELDDEKKNNLLNYIDGDMQVIITTTDINNIDEKLVKAAKIIEIDNAKIIKTNEVEK